MYTIHILDMSLLVSLLLIQKQEIFAFIDLNKDDTLPYKRQALAWQKEPKAWTQALQRYKQFFYQSGM